MKQNYVENEDLIPLLIEYKKTCRYENNKYVKGSGIMSEELGKIVLMIAEGVSTLPKFNGYTWRQDMVSSAVLTVCKYLHNFDVETSKNPFAYISTICSNAFLQYIAMSKKHSDIKKELYAKKPSYMENNEFYDTQAIDYESIKNWENKEDET